MFSDDFDACWMLGPLDCSLGPWSPAEPCMGGVWELSRFGGICGEKSAQKKVSECVWGYFWGRGRMNNVSGFFDAFWAL